MSQLKPRDRQLEQTELTSTMQILRPLFSTSCDALLPHPSSPLSGGFMSAGADVHRAQQGADGHGARCWCHAREHGHARAHICESEPIPFKSCPHVA